MKWLMEFYNERRGILVRHGVEAALPAAAVRLGRKAVLAKYPPAPRRRPSSLFERAHPADAHGWVLHRIVNDSGPGFPDGAAAHVVPPSDDGGAR
jgi:hypothetical protein